MFADVTLLDAVEDGEGNVILSIPPTTDITTNEPPTDITTNEPPVTEPRKRLCEDATQSCSNGGKPKKKRLVRDLAEHFDVETETSLWTSYLQSEIKKNAAKEKLLALQEKLLALQAKELELRIKKLEKEME